MKIVKGLIFWLFSLLLIIIVTLLLYVLIALIQNYIFVPTDYMLWVFKYPASRLVLIFELYLIFAFFCISNKLFKGMQIPFVNTLLMFAKRNKKWFYPAFGTINLIVAYFIIFNVTVISVDKITDYSFSNPQGVEYNYNDIKSIRTGVYGKNLYLPFTHTKGDFYYIIILNDGQEIDLNDSVGGTKNDEDCYKLFEEFDTKLVDMGITKTSSTENFKFCTAHLAQIYTNRISRILYNTP